MLNRIIPLGAALALGGCVVATQPALVASPGQGKSQASFQQDEASCRQQASQAAYASPGAGAPPVDTTTRSGNAASWQRYDTAYAQCIAGHGDTVQPLAYAPGYGGYAYPYGGYAYGYPYPYGYGYPFGFVYPGYFGGFYPGIGFGFGYGGFGYGRFGYGYGRGFGYGGYGHGFGGGFGHGGFGGGGGFHGGGGHR